MLLNIDADTIPDNLAPTCKTTSKSDEADPTLHEPQHVVDNIALGELLWHPSTKAFENKLGVKIPQLFHHLFLRSDLFHDRICLTTTGWKHHRDLGTFHARQGLHAQLFTYVLKRISCIQFVQAEGYIIRDDFYTPTDGAFAYVLCSLFRAAEGAENFLEFGGNVALMVEDGRAVRALEVCMRHPMRFKIQRKVGQLLQKEGLAVVWCRDVKGGGWEVIWEVMEKGLGRVIVPEANYWF